MNDSTPGASAEIQENPEESHAESFPLVPVTDPESAAEERAIVLAEKNQIAVAGRISPFSRVAPELDSVTPFARPSARAIRNDADTEHLLNGLIAECHLLMRSVALPTAMRAADADTRNQFLGTAILLAKTGVRVGRAVAKVRGAGASTEFVQRDVRERYFSAPQFENGAKT